MLHTSLEIAGLCTPTDGLANRKAPNLLLLANPVTPAARSVESFLHKQIEFPEANELSESDPSPI